MVQTPTSVRASCGARTRTLNSRARTWRVADYSTPQRFTTSRCVEGVSVMRWASIAAGWWRFRPDGIQDASVRGHGPTDRSSMQSEDMFQPADCATSRGGRSDGSMPPSASYRSLARLRGWSERSSLRRSIVKRQENLLLSSWTRACLAPRSRDGCEYRRGQSRITPGGSALRSTIAADDGTTGRRSSGTTTLATALGSAREHLASRPRAGETRSSAGTSSHDLGPASRNNVRREHTHRNRGALKRRLIRDGFKTGCCEVCGIDGWLGRPLTMTLHHMNGDRLDNRIENLQLLCANCHSQTSTFGGRNGRWPVG